MSTVAQRVGGLPAARQRSGLGSKGPVSLGDLTAARVLLLVGGHCLLAEIIQISPWLSSFYAWGIAIYAVSTASTKRPKQAWEVLSYLISAEILWRMTRAWAAPIPVFWEFGKYASIVCLLAIGSRSRGPIPWVPVTYLCLLLPSLPFTLALGFQESRQLIAFNLSGPFTLALSAIVARRMRAEDRPGLKEFMAAIWPIAGVAWLCTRAVASGVAFGTESSVAASGGYGPNQVSTMLGFGALCALLVAADPKTRPQIGLIFTALAGWFVLQGVLTFSRGGMIAGAIPLVLVVVQGFRSGARGGSRTIAWALCAVLGLGVAAWAANSLSGGLAASRYGEIDATGRAELAKSDVEIAREHPVMGVGPGMTTKLHSEYAGKFAAPHTEFTRTLAEHGAIGVAGGILMLLWSAGVAWSSRRHPHVLLGGALMTWSALTMGHSAMRLAATGVAWGMGLCLMTTSGDLRPKGLARRSRGVAFRERLSTPHPSRADSRLQSRSRIRAENTPRRPLPGAGGDGNPRSRPHTG